MTTHLKAWERGSQWRRWNPHIHAPGTLRNDQFAGDWDGYLKAIETASPVVEVLGITDYYSIACYKEVRAWQQKGRLPNVGLIFPNVEMRLAIETQSGQALNIHLLFSPEDPEHERHIERNLARLFFEFKRTKYPCTSDGLASLGRAHDQRMSSEAAAHSEGANQFKVTLDDLRSLFREDAWIEKNCVVAVPGSNNDGVAGLQKDGASFHALRSEVERFAHVILSSTPSSRTFWAGQAAGWDASRLEAEFGGRKPCLHGCDAHCVEKTCNPDQQRFCWIKGDPTFESLRQALLEPKERVWIGESAPDRHNSSMCISRVRIQGTPWLTRSEVEISPGLVAIIGARGSGKTALADIIAVGTNVLSPVNLESSFLSRAASHLTGARVSLEWGDGTVEGERSLQPGAPFSEERGAEGARYLSQQFVEQLCSAEGLALELRQEIERVIFEATEQKERLDSDSFEQLAEIHLDPIRRRRQELQEAIEDTSAQVNAEEALQARLLIMRKDRETRQSRIAKAKQEMTALLPKNKEDLRWTPFFGQKTALP